MSSKVIDDVADVVEPAAVVTSGCHYGSYSGEQQEDNGARAGNRGATVELVRFASVGLGGCFAESARGKRSPRSSVLIGLPDDAPGVLAARCAVCAPRY